MDLLGLAIRAAATFVFLLVLLRLAGKRTIGQVSPFDFVIALVLGDLVDDAVLAEVPMAQFVTAAGVLVAASVALAIPKRKHAGD